MPPNQLLCIPTPQNDLGEDQKSMKFKQLSSQNIVENKTNYLYLPALNTIYVKKCFMVFAQCSHFDQSHSTAETVSLDISLAMLQRNL